MLVKIPVMMMVATAAFRRHRKQGGEGPPSSSSSSSSSLTSSLDGRRVSPLVLGSHGVGGARAPPRWIYLSVSAFSDSAPSPFPLYLEIRNSDWMETFAQIFFQKLSFLRPKKGINHLTRAPGGWGRAHLEWAWAPVSWPPRAPSRVDFTSQKSQIFQNNSPSILSHLDSV